MDVHFGDSVGMRSIPIAIPDELGVLTVALLLALLAPEEMFSPFPPISERTKTARRRERIA
jgi:hypothetical protein